MEKHGGVNVQRLQAVFLVLDRLASIYQRPGTNACASEAPPPRKASKNRVFQHPRVSPVLVQSKRIVQPGISSTPHLPSTPSNICTSSLPHSSFSPTGSSLEARRAFNPTSSKSSSYGRECTSPEASSA